MKKILTGMFLVALTVSLVSGAAYALFSDQVQVNNLAITTGNADLKISVDGGGPWVDSYTQGPWLAENVYPGWSDDVHFWLKNDSKSNIDLLLTARLATATGNWSELADVLEVRIRTIGGPADSGWHTLTWWNSADRSIDGYLTPDQVKELEVSLRVPSTVENEIANKSISTNWVIDATQWIH